MSDWKIWWKKISGFLQNSGTMIDYIYLKLGGNDVIATNNSDLFFQSFQSGNIWYTQTTLTTFTLLAGKTYDLCAYIRTTTVTVNDYIEINWVDWSNIPLTQTTPAYITGNWYSKAAGIIVISSDTVIKLRVTILVGVVTIKNTWWVQIKQVGWTNLLVWTMNITPTVSEYATVGTFTWTKPLGCRYIEVEVIGGGGGSASIGSTYTFVNTNINFINTGGNGWYYKGIIYCWSIPQINTISVVVGWWSIPLSATLTNIIAGNSGGTWSFGGYIICGGGAGSNFSVGNIYALWSNYNNWYAINWGTITTSWNVIRQVSDNSNMMIYYSYNNSTSTTVANLTNYTKNPYIEYTDNYSSRIGNGNTTYYTNNPSCYGKGSGGIVVTGWSTSTGNLVGYKGYVRVVEYY